MQKRSNWSVILGDKDILISALGPLGTEITLSDWFALSQCYTSAVPREAEHIGEGVCVLTSCGLGSHISEPQGPHP